MTRKYVVITGASAGIGYQLALEFANIGKNLVLVARREEKLLELKQELLRTNNQLDIKIISCDLSKLENVYNCYQQLSGLEIEVFINNAGFGNFESIAEQSLVKIEALINLNITALTILSSLYVADYQDVEGAQLINVSSTGGYSIVNNAVTYCSSKFYVSSFTEGLSQELLIANKKLKAKVLAPAATETEFAKVASDVSEFTYSGNFHTAKQMAKFAIELYHSDKVVGKVNSNNYQFELLKPQFEFRTQGATAGIK